MSDRYALVVPFEKIEDGIIARRDATRYEPLERITLPAGGGERSGRIVLTYTDGDVETVEGYLLESGVMDE